MTLWLVLWVVAGIVGAGIVTRQIGKLTVAWAVADIFAAAIGGPITLFIAIMVTVGQRVLWRRKE